MPYETRTVQQSGVVIDHVNYFSDPLRPYIKAPDPHHPERKLSLRFHYDPRDMSVLYYLDPQTQRYTLVTYRDITHPPLSRWELNAARRALEEQVRREIDEVALFQAHAELRRRQEAAVRETTATRRQQARRAGWRAAERPALEASAPAAAHPGAPVAPGDPHAPPPRRRHLPFDEAEDD